MTKSLEEPDQDQMTLLHGQPAARADLTDKVCPMTFVHIRLCLERLDSGQTAELALRGEQMADIPRTLKAEGHRVLSVRQDGDRFWLLVRKGAVAGEAI